MMKYDNINSIHKAIHALGEYLDVVNNPEIYNIKSMLTDFIKKK